MELTLSILRGLSCRRHIPLLISNACLTLSSAASGFKSLSVTVVGRSIPVTWERRRKNRFGIETGSSFVDVIMSSSGMPANPETALRGSVPFPVPSFHLSMDAAIYLETINVYCRKLVSSTRTPKLLEWILSIIRWLQAILNPSRDAADPLVLL